MESTQEFFDEGEAEATLVSPRFDVQELQTARAVVPLTQPQAARGGASRRPRSLGLILMSALLGGAVSVFAFRLYQQRHQADAAAPATAAAPTRTQPAPTVAKPAAPVETAANDVRNATAQPTLSAPSAVGEKRNQPAVAQPNKDELEREKTVAVATDARRTAKTEVVRSNERPAAAVTSTERERPKARMIEVIPAAPRQAEADARRDDNGGLSAEERRARRRERREPRTQPRNVDRIRDIFEGSPPF